MGVIEEKFKWDGQLPKPSNMKFSYEDANALSDAISTAATTVIAPSNSMHTDRANYTLPGTADQTMLNTAIAASKGRIVILDGDVHISGDVFMASDRIVSGLGYATNIIGDSHCDIDIPNLTNFQLRNLRITGTTRIDVNFTVGGRKNLLLENIHISNDTPYITAFQLWADGVAVSDITFKNCIAEACDGFGFLIVGPNGPTFKRVNFEGCQALECGYAATRSSVWATGFNLMEATGNCTMEDCTIQDCYAYRCYESGFHAEGSVSRTYNNVKYINCVSEDNGIDKPSPTFGAGFLMPGQGVLILDCVARGNLKYGIYNHGGDTIKCRVYGEGVTETGIHAGGSHTRHKIINNLVDGVIANGIAVSTAGAQSIFTGNTVQNIAAITGFGLYVPSADYATIVENNIVEIPTSGISKAIYLTETCGRGFTDRFIDMLAEDNNQIVITEDLTQGTPIACTLRGSQPDSPQPITARNVTIEIVDANASISAFQITVTGTNAKGYPASEVFTFTGGLVQAGNVAWLRVASVTVDSITGAGAGDTLDIGIGSKLGLSNIIFNTGCVVKVEKNNGSTASTDWTANADYDTVDVSAGVPINANDDFIIYYVSSHNRII